MGARHDVDFSQFKGITHDPPRNRRRLRLLGGKGKDHDHR